VAGDRSARPPGGPGGLYDRRMGLGIPRAAASAKSRTPEYLARFTLLVGVALLLWTAVGQALGPPPLQAEGPPPLPASGGHPACRVRLSVRFIQQRSVLPISCGSWGGFSRRRSGGRCASLGSWGALAGGPGLEGGEGEAGAGSV
jgi:hypothetical protein